MKPFHCNFVQSFALVFWNILSERNISQIILHSTNSPTPLSLCSVVSGLSLQLVPLLHVHTAALITRHSVVYTAAVGALSSDVALL